jgi:hypothetical protein
MTAERYFRWTIWLPIALPVVWVAGLNVLSLFGVQQNDTRVAGVLFFSMLIGGVPYVLFASVGAWLLRRATLRRLQIASLCAPPAYAALLFVIVVAAAFPALSQYGITEALVPARFYAGWALALGYVYVALAHVGFLVLRRVGSVDVSPGGA